MNKKDLNKLGMIYESTWWAKQAAKYAPHDHIVDDLTTVFPNMDEKTANKLAKFVQDWVKAALEHHHDANSPWKGY